MKRKPELYLGDDGIFYEYHYVPIIDKEQAVFVAKERNRLSDIKRPLLVKFKALKGYSSDTREMDLDVILKSVSALAYAVDINTVEGKETKKVIETWFYITPWPIPVEVFHSEDEAITWLKTHISN